MRLTVEQIQSATGGKIIVHGAGFCDGVSTDSRTVAEGELFVPVAGARFNGHDFIEKALERKAAGFAFSNTKLDKEKAAGMAAERKAMAVSVEDTLKALGDLALFVRNSIAGLKVVAITGSTGKSTTKEMLAAILSRSRKTLKNEGNLNNLVGVPLTLFRLEEDTEAAVVELGANAPGEIAELARITNPDAGCVTNVGRAHLEGLGSLDGVSLEKGALAEALGERAFFAVNCDDEFVAKMADKTGARIICFGLNSEPLKKCEEFITAEVTSTGPVKAQMTLVAGEQRVGLQLCSPGMHNVMNALAAASLARAVGASMEEIARGLVEYEPMPMRSETLKAGRGITVLIDCYNSNPSGLEAALELFSGFPGRLVAVLGDMLEMGSYAREAHVRAGEMAAERGVEILVAVGEWAEHMKLAYEDKAGASAKALTAPDASRASELILKNLRDGDSILVKGSRKVGLEAVVEAVRKAVGENRAGGET